MDDKTRSAWTRWGFLSAYLASLALFTLWLALDTFVIPHIYDVTSRASDTPSADSFALLPTTAPAVIQEDRYEDANIHIVLSEYREHDTTIYAADVTLTSPELLQTALAQGSYGRNVTEKTTSMAQTHGAILAINGDFYGSRERGYVIRNGIVYRSTVSGSEALAIMSDGSFRIVQEGDVSAEQLVDDGAMHVFSFGPALVENGEISVTTADEVGKAMADNPRTAIGVFQPGHYVLLVSDGRTRESEGLTLYELAQFMQGLGVTTAYNLDGGGSSTMVFNGNLINNPTTNGRRITERSVSDIVYIGY